MEDFIHNNKYKTIEDLRKYLFKVKKAYHISKTKNIIETEDICTYAGNGVLIRDTIQNSNFIIVCISDFQYGKGLSVAFSFEKNKENLSRLEKFKKSNVFKQVFETNNPATIEEFKGIMRVTFTLGNPEIKPVWNRNEETNNLIKNFTLKQKLIAKLYPEKAKAKIQKWAPKCYTNCQEKMQGKSYLELMDCEKLFAKEPEQEMGK